MAKTDEPNGRSSGSNSQPNRADRRVIDLDDAGENAGVEDTPYNAPEETEARRRLARKDEPRTTDEPQTDRSKP